MSKEHHGHLHGLFSLYTTQSNQNNTFVKKINFLVSWYMLVTKDPDHDI